MGIMFCNQEQRFDTDMPRNKNGYYAFYVTSLIKLCLNDRKKMKWKFEYAYLSYDMNSIILAYFKNNEMLYHKYQ